MMQIDMQSSFLIGSTMALIARNKLPGATEQWLARARAVALAFGGAVFAPTCLYISLRWTPWETMYLWDRSTLPTALLGLFLVGVAAASFTGFHLTCKLIRGGHMPGALLLNGAVLASCLVIVVAGWEHVGFVGSLDEFAAGARSNFLGSDLPQALAVIGLIYCPVVLLVIRWLRRSNHEA